jgi:hypothetical protein
MLMTLVIVLGFWRRGLSCCIGEHAPRHGCGWALSWALGILPTSGYSAGDCADDSLRGGGAFRVWGTAYLGTGTVNNAEMKAGVVMADGPYRYVRNPLYIGSWLMVAAISVLMPPSGAPFTMVVLSVFLLRLILGEEAFLATQLGEPYIAYRKAVPRLIPKYSASRSYRWAKCLTGVVRRWERFCR